MNRPAFPNQTTIATYGLIFLVALIAHGLILVHDGFHTEDYAYFDAVASRDWDQLRGLLDGRASIQQFYSHAVMGYLPEPFFAYKLENFLSIVAVGILTYQIAVKTKLVHELDAVFIGLFVMVYPGFQFTYPVVAWHQFDLAWFLAGVLLALHSKSSTSACRIMCRVASIAAFAFSLTINSFIVFYGAFFLLLLLVDVKANGFDLRRMPRNLDYALLPILYYVLSLVLFPRVEGYNSISVSNLFNAQLWWRTFDNAVVFQFVDAVRLLGSSIPVSVITTVLLAASLAIFFQFHRGQRYSSGLGLIAFGLVTIPFALAPYIIVAKVPELWGAETRHALLLTFPFALILVGLIRLLFLNRSKTYLAGLAVHFVLLVGLSVVCLNIYFVAQARSAWEQSILHNIQNTEGAEDASIYWLINNYPEYWPNDDIPRSLQVNYHGWILNRVLETIWPEKLIDGGLIAGWTSSYQPFITTEMLYLGPHQPLLEHGEPPEIADWEGYSGCQVVISVEATDKFENDRDMALQHLYHRFLARSELDRFLSDLSEVHIQPISVPEATKCPRVTDGPLVFNPRTDTSMALAAFYLTVLPAFHHQPEQPDLTRLVLENTVYETTVSPSLLPAIEQWRESYLPGHLQDIGIDYLFVDMEWASWLSEAQYRVIFESPEYYELVYEWNDPVWSPPSGLYRVVGNETASGNMVYP